MGIPFGVLFGVASVVSEMVILETQPKRHSGKVNATKTSLKIVLRAIAVLIAGVFWDDNFGDSLWISIACVAVLISALSIVMMVAVCFRKKKTDHMPIN